MAGQDKWNGQWGESDGTGCVQWRCWSQKSGLLTAVHRSPTRSVVSKLQSQFGIFGKTWVPYIFLKLITTFKKIYLLQSQKQPSKRKGKQTKILFSVWVHERPGYFQSVRCPSPGLRRFMNERFVGICLVQTECLGKPRTTGSVPNWLRRLPRVWKYQFLKRERGWRIIT